ncbi:hypothetical protein T08_15807 [Trichinella sp. T8]|nr:hypothetical protein T08_15807 [Trichinella sp. T8]
MGRSRAVGFRHEGGPARGTQLRSGPGGSETCSGCFIRRTRTRQAGRPEAARTRLRTRSKRRASEQQPMKFCCEKVGGVRGEIGTRPTNKDTVH